MAPSCSRGTANRVLVSSVEYPFRSCLIPLTYLDHVVRLSYRIRKLPAGNGGPILRQTHVEQVIIELLQELGCAVSNEPVEITSMSTPLSDLAFFDSLLGLEMTVALEQRLGITIEEQTVFCEKDTREPLSIAQIAEKLVREHSGVAD